MIVLPGGSYIFFWPILIALATYFTVHFLKDKICPYVRASILGINIIFVFILYIPILYLIYLALTIGALGIVALLAFFPFIIGITTSLLVLKES